MEIFSNNGTSEPIINSEPIMQIVATFGYSRQLGNLNKLKTAILYGADAVYLAGQKYSLRAGADNFTTAELKQS